MVAKFTSFFILLMLALGGAALAGESPASTQTARATPGAQASILPPQFAGWQVSGSTKVSKDPAVADPVNAALLREYGLTDFESGTYTRDDGRKVALKPFASPMPAAPTGLSRTTKCPRCSLSRSPTRARR
jgi:hypothetical protein